MAKKATVMKFSDLPPTVQKGLTLVWKVRENAVNGIGGHFSNACPLYYGYGITACSEWKDLTPDDMRILAVQGWTPRRDETVIKWYDAILSTESCRGNEIRFRKQEHRSHFLIHFLRSRSLPSGSFKVSMAAK